MDQIVACIQSGADDYLLKPFNPVLLQARISAGIERKRWHDREEDYRHQLERNERFIRQTFGRYLSDDIVAQLLEAPEGLELGGDLREVTIMMSDICGFTSLAEHLPPPQVVALLNGYFEHMTSIIFDHEGTIDEFLGDAILAVFRRAQAARERPRAGGPLCAGHARSDDHCQRRQQSGRLTRRYSNALRSTPALSLPGTSAQSSAPSMAASVTP
ncbi:MAG: hypothetical protein CM15mP103_10600 [Gammaproteobacteria bacterium]|nr:MAG: hypothetical protein CM15mP103_10600 [Gammaproteobacteria bacterium]